MRTRLSARYSSIFEGKSALRRVHDVWSRRTDKERKREREGERERERGSETALFRVELSSRWWARQALVLCIDTSVVYP